MTFTQETPSVLARRLRAAPGKDVWIMGGATLAGAFVQAGEVDDLIVHVIPTLLGEGIPLLRGLQDDVALTLKEARPFPDGVVRLHYTVDRAARPTGCVPSALILSQTSESPSQTRGSKSETLPSGLPEGG